MESRIVNKAQMYRHLSEGRFGNTIAQYFSIEAWKNSEDYKKFDSWGIRSLTVGGKCFFYVPSSEVEQVVKDNGLMGINISCMVDAVARVLMWADVCVTSAGWYLYCVRNPARGESWRVGMPSRGKTYVGLAAVSLLRSLLTPSSMSDLEAVLEKWPDHVVELSALDRCMGTTPGRNAVVWEVRYY